MIKLTEDDEMMLPGQPRQRLSVFMFLSEGISPVRKIEHIFGAGSGFLIMLNS
jgi:hypothetical protein